ncbi:helix-turn-helix domain-containing protein [Kibdelosporangium lantanae]|uniref:Helix-turn-helix domain-containing protein n=1 Tax=Kibdelosporangium lantanae TaxID=1497396 RepID=A0ABW3MAP1_9PSEU
MTEYKKGARITGIARDKLADVLMRKYAKGTSIRELADQIGRSYGFVHRLLDEAGVEFRGRGGNTRGRRKTGRNS